MNAGYKFHPSGNGFEFYTAFGSAYAVSLVPSGEYFENNLLKDFLFRVDIVQTDPGPFNRFDLPVGITIAEILYHFFEVDDRRILFYICDPSDGRMKARERKFHYWYRLFSNSQFNKRHQSGSCFYFSYKQSVSLRHTYYYRTGQE
ncbi:MAG: hypothetical protein JWR72_1924 [Flavisolibacter sp.]|nr:hypothetical protein [Flavisolibacter sp.]